MAVTSKWRHHIERWQSSGLTQAEYCEQQQINVKTFTARLSDYRKLSAADSVTLVPVQIVSKQPDQMKTHARQIGKISQGNITLDLYQYGMSCLVKSNGCGLNPKSCAAAV